MSERNGWVGLQLLASPVGIGMVTAGAWLDLDSGEVLALDHSPGDREAVVGALRRVLEAGRAAPERLSAHHVDLPALRAAFEGLTFVEAGPIGDEWLAEAVDRYLAPWTFDHWGLLLPRALVAEVDAAARSFGALPWIPGGRMFRVDAAAFGIVDAVASLSQREGPMLRLAPSQAEHDGEVADLFDLGTPVIVLVDRTTDPVGPVLSVESADGVVADVPTARDAEACLAVLKALHAAVATGVGECEGVRVEALAARPRVRASTPMPPVARPHAVRRRRGPARTRRFARA